MSAEHPWLGAERARRDESARRRAQRGTPGKRGRGRRHHGEWRCTHLLVYEDLTIGQLYFWRAAYYTLEQYTCGEPGMTRKDLREGETIESAYETREEDQ